ncbi:uncharacterized protein N7459_003828 [Penicillium hispanicum]|uniref:uncharacterized protein n=1 Tax=Penicillium hispanicum TaxID=1080232 RepID=UPI00253F9846|nr:uncharacterized protein N7459_003828 [Penicillium hispanicum]KAJ5584028.1 hypothetical protein N7459_003828 [Penicillium hispanicum]
MSGNYDYPPASSRRPSRPDEVRVSSPPPFRFLIPSETFNEHFRQSQEYRGRYPRTQQLIEYLRAPHTDDPLNQDEPRLEPSLSDILNPVIDQASEGTPRDSQNSTSRPRDRLHYLRNLVQSENSRAPGDGALRALEVLNQEVEQQNLELEQLRDRSNIDEARAALDRQIQQLRSDQTQGSRRPWMEQVIHRPSSASSPASNQEPRPTSTRTLLRRSFRPDLRESLPTPPLMPQPSQNGRGRLKRRKLDSDDNREGVRGFNYGQYGQVVPGALKMEIASCDGGIYDPDGDSSFPENVLRNDQTVYCTKSDRCNLVLRHRGEAPFCLKKIVIKAPRAGFDSPIQEGMVFVSMTSDELLARTAQYQIQYSSTRRRRRNRRMGLQPSQEYLNAFRSPPQSMERTVLMGPDSHSTVESEPAGRDAPDPQSEFRVTTEYDENPEENVFMEREDDDVPSIAELERIQGEEDLLCSDSEEDSATDEDDHYDRSTFHRRRLELQRRIGSMRRQYSDPSQRRRQPPSLVDPIPAASAAGPSGETTPMPHAEVMKPHARFFIEREKSMVSIKFDPPPYAFSLPLLSLPYSHTNPSRRSGRYILIKLWSPRSDGNIDIQSIIAHGYAGPRFFPSGGFR